MNQETYEMVLSDAKFLSECINRDQGLYIMQMEGNGYKQYKAMGLDHSKYKELFKFKLCSKGGSAIMRSNGEVVYYFDKFDEYITCNREHLMTERTGIFFGDQKALKLGSIQIDNRKTGEYAIVEFVD